MTITHSLAGLTLLFYMMHIFRLFPLTHGPKPSALIYSRIASKSFVCGLITHSLFLYFVISDAISLTSDSLTSDSLASDKLGILRNLTFESSPSLFLLSSSLIFFIAIAMISRGKAITGETSVVHRFSILLGLCLFLIGGLGIHSRESFVEYNVEPLLIIHLLFSILGQVLVYFLAIISILIWLLHYRLKRKLIKGLEGFPAMSSLEKIFLGILRLCTSFLFLSLLTGVFKIFTSADNVLANPPLVIKFIFVVLFFVASCYSLMALRFNMMSIPKSAKQISIVFTLLLFFQVTFRTNIIYFFGYSTTESTRSSSLRENS